jgi:UDP-N-acetyl-D-glucosamine dehydrogenase
MKIVVIGMGKIGLPLAVSFALTGHKVVGLDIQKDVVASINNGTEPFPGEANLEKFLNQVLRNENFYATTEFAATLSMADVVVVCIPLMLNDSGQPDFTNIDNLVIEIGKFIKSNVLISFETTLPVGTTRNRFTLILEKESRMKVGQDFYVVFSPERVMTGRIFEDLRRYPKLVGGVTQNCSKRGVLFYRSVMVFDVRSDLVQDNGVWEMENAEAAEFTKIAETTYRDVNIGLANEFAVFARKNSIDILQVIEASNSQQYSHIHTPGLSVGGHCIPVYPKFYSWVNSESQIAQAARDRNLSMPINAINQIKEIHKDLNGLKIGVLGITYRPGVKEVALSGALVLLELLKSEGAYVFGDDPFLNQEEITALGFDNSRLPDDLDGLILHTAHSIYQDFDFSLFKKLAFFYDGRNSHAFLKHQDKFNYFSI